MVLVPGHGQPRPPRWRFIGAYPGESRLLAEHIERGVLYARAAGAVLVFSGGMTRAEAGPVSEATAYRDYATHQNWFGGEPPVVLLEEYARDSLENVSLSLACYRQAVGAFPEQVTAVGWRFKAERFKLHAAVLEVWLKARGVELVPGWFTYLGINDPPPRLRRQAEVGERLKLAALHTDLLLLGRPWAEQRAARNPFGRRAPYPLLGKVLPDLDSLGQNTQPHPGLPEKLIQLPKGIAYRSLGLG